MSVSKIFILTSIIVCVYICVMAVSGNLHTVPLWKRTLPIQTPINKCPNGTTVLVLGLSTASIGNEFERHMHTMQNDMESALYRDNRTFLVLDSMRTPIVELQQAKTCTSHIMVNFMVLRLLCAWDSPSFTNVIGTLAYPMPYVRERSYFLREYLHNSTAIKGGWLNDIHPYSFGPYGHVRAAQCVEDLNLTHLLASYFFTPDMLSLSSAIASKTSQEVRIWNMPFHIREEPLQQQQSIQRDYDILIMGSTLRQVYPFRHRLSQLVITSRLFSYIICSGGVATGYNAQGIRRILGPCTGTNMHAIVRRCRLGISTAQGHSMYNVFKYTELPTYGTAVLGNVPLDARITQFPDLEKAALVPLRESDTDASLLATIQAALRVDMEEKIRFTRVYIHDTVGLDHYAEHVKSVLFDDEFHPIPSFLQTGYMQVMNSLNYLDLLEYNTWDGLVLQLLRLGNNTII